MVTVGQERKTEPSIVTPAKATEGSAEPGGQFVEFPGSAFPSVRLRRPAGLASILDTSVATIEGGTAHQTLTSVSDDQSGAY